VLGTDMDTHHSLENPMLLLPFLQVTLPQTELHQIHHNHIHDTDRDVPAMMSRENNNKISDIM
jgi:hypothetical protein